MEIIVEGQMSLFDLGKTPFKITKPIRLIELFAGVGSQAMALRDIGANFEHYRAIEFDKYAIASYNAIHGTNFPTMDVTKITGEDLGITDCHKYTYLLTYSFPCTDLSVAGKMLGMAEGSGTRSSLLWEVKRLLDETKELPQVLVMENVPQVHSKANMPHFQKWIDYLSSKGYCTYWQDMNAKDYGVAQSRNRTIAVSALGNYSFTFPKPYPLDKAMKDYLEPVVEEKYYLNNQKARDLIDKLIVGEKILTNKQPPAMHVECEVIGGIGEIDFGKQYRQGNRVYNAEKICPALSAQPLGNNAGNSSMFLEIKQATKQGTIRCEVGGVADLNYPTSQTRRGRVIEQGNVSPTLTTENIPSVLEPWIWEIDGTTYLIRIRKLTPKECWRLMDFSDEDFEKAKSVNSNTQLYKQAGNSIVKNVLCEVFKKIIGDEDE